jgi:thymidylate kinase
MGKIIGISGVARSGKDTMLDSLAEIYGNENIIRLAFADALKEECDSFLKKNTGISAFTSDDREKSMIRPFLVTYGTHIRRRINPRCWIEVISKTINSDKNYAITDVRFPNEAQWIKDLKGTLIHVSRTGVDPANKDEEINDPILKSMSDIKINMPTYRQEFSIKCKKKTEEQLRNRPIWI